MEIERETGWKLHPLDGETGHAYMGTKDEEKLFVKLNTSPFLAALSIEGISPRLVWTKRIGNGDVITAQEWCNGRNLNRKEMNWERVAETLKKLHASTILKKMLKNVGGEKVLPSDLLAGLFDNLPVELENHPTVIQAVEKMASTREEVTENPETAVCHGDMSHKNWLLSDEDQLYLVDWDSVVLADPAYDVGQLLSRYIDNEDWKEWLKDYDGNYTEEFSRRVQWYSLISCLQDIKSSHGKQQYPEMNRAIMKLDSIIK